MLAIRHCPYCNQSTAGEHHLDCPNWAQTPRPAIDYGSIYDTLTHKAENAKLRQRIADLEAQLAEARTRWPTGDEAVKQLAEAANDVQWDYLSHSQPIEVWRVFLAAVLQRLAKGGSHADAD